MLKLNLNYSKDLWLICAKNNIPFVYASSAATYGLGELGFNDNHDIVEKLKPLNPYGDSKNDFDRWVEKDIEYIENWSLILDLKIIFKTFREIFKLTGD